MKAEPVARADDDELLRFEEKAAEMYARGKIKGFLHLYIGQEASPPRIAALRPTTTSSRTIASTDTHCARLEPGRVMAELFARQPASPAAAAARCHLFDVEKCSTVATPCRRAHAARVRPRSRRAVRGTDRIVANFIGADR